MPCQLFGTVITALGSPLTFQEPVAAITAAMNEQARNAFGKHPKLLCARTPKGRLRMHTTMVRMEPAHSASRQGVAAPVGGASVEQGGGQARPAVQRQHRPRQLVAVGGLQWMHKADRATWNNRTEVFVDTP